VSFLLRKVRKNRWDSVFPAWLTPGDFQADPLGDLSTSGNTLSVYRVNNDKSNLNRIILALAAGCDNFANIDYIFFEESIIKEIGIKTDATLGTTADSEVNNLHIDLVELSASKLVKLCQMILENGTTGRILKDDIVTGLEANLNQGYYDLRKLTEQKKQKILNEYRKRSTRA